MGEVGGTSENEQPSSGALNRRNMLKAAVAAGAGVAAWTAPDIKTLGFKPALAQGGSPVVILSAEPDLNSNSGQHDCFPEGAAFCCDQSWGPSGGGSDQFVFDSPVPGCDQVVVTQDTSFSNGGACDTSTINPDMGQARLYISSTTGTCNCTILEAVVLRSSQRIEQFTVNNGPADCGGIDISISDCGVIDSDYRLAVRIECTV